MSTPSDDLITALRASDALSGANVHGMRSQVVAPAVVVRPDEPWMRPGGFCPLIQQYVVVLTVAAATPEDGTNDLYRMALVVIDALPETWEFVSVGSPIIDESTGTSFLVAPVRLNYKGAAA